MLQLIALRSTIVVFIGLAALHLFLFNDLFEKIHSLRFDIIMAIKEQQPIPMAAPAQVAPAQVTSPKSVEDAEKWKNLVSMTSVVPRDVKEYFTYSETEAARLSGLEGDHPDIIDYIRKNKFIPPPPVALRNKDPAVDVSTSGISEFVVELTRNKRNGFFIECGAFDGKTHSTTFLMERKLDWTGLLIEAEPTNFHATIEKHRNAILVPACLSLGTKPKMNAFHVGRQMQGKIVEDNKLEGTVKVQCLPLYSVLLAANKTTVDVFCLDIEGNELDVLKTIPFDKVDIKVFVIEHYNIKNGPKILEEFMTGKGYVTIPPSAPKDKNWATWDCVFVKKGSGYLETHP